MAFVNLDIKEELDFSEKKWQEWLKSVTKPPIGKCISIKDLPDDGTKSGMEAALKFSQGLIEIANKQKEE